MLESQTDYLAPRCIAVNQKLNVLSVVSPCFHAVLTHIDAIFTLSYIAFIVSLLFISRTLES